MITALVAGTFFIEMLDGTVIATALPRIGADFGVSPVALNIGMTAYLLALAVLIPISGWVADRFGSRTVFASAIALFTVASMLCGLSGSMWTFTAARALQGAGGAAMVPIGRLIVLGMTERQNFTRAMATITWPGLIAPVLGPPIGGFIVLHWSWPWIFFLNVPLGLLALTAAMTIVPNKLAPATPRALDFLGFVLSGASLVLIVYGLDALGNGLQEPMVPALATLVGIGLGAAGVRHLRRHPTPLIDLSALSLPSFAAIARGGSLQRVGIGTVPFLLPLLFQLAFGLDPLRAGELVLFVFAGNLAMKIVSFRIIERLGFRNVMTINGVLSALSIGACALLTASTPYAVMAALLFAGGAFRSLQFAAMSGLQFTEVPVAKLSHANTLSAMLTQLTMGFGIVFGAGMLNASALLRGHRPGAPDIVDFQAAFVGVMIIVMAGLVDTFRIDRTSGIKPIAD